MAARMQNLNISPLNSTMVPVQPLPDVVLSTSMEPQYCQEAGDLQRLKELEKRYHCFLMLVVSPFESY